jgi:hypothetical protein
MSMGNTVFALSDEVRNPQGVELQVYRMVDLSSLSEPLLPSVIPVKVGKVALPDFYRIIGVNMHRMSSDLALVGITRYAVAIAKFTIPGPIHDGPLTASVKTLMDDAQPDEDELLRREASVCVATGRLAVGIPTRDLQWRIQVFDYLSLA